ncbi:MAG: winged helix-turn-helix transcriptional regulator [Candidatus Aenigmarchaeota archaeon]|nr:winged helix-turn-helix transcriptional regulator [Candidatus Aenigmarchaeota archaeon]
MEIDKSTIKALASDTKSGILKKLEERRKMPAELSKELNLSPSTVVEHLKALENLGLVKKTETGHKWVYYELTEKSRNIVKPKIPVQNIFMLSLGIVLTIGSFISYLFQSAASQFTESASIQNIAGVEKAAQEIAETPQTADISQFSAATDYFLIVIFAIGIILIAYSMWKLRQAKKETL